ncbi:MAG: histidine kinase [Bacteroidales bacterium]|nr:histidine kinase [Bacteroidales bacterium]
MNSNYNIFNKIYSKKISFWKANLSAWFLFSVVWAILYSEADYSASDVLKVFISNFLIPIAITTLLRYLFKQLPLNRFSINIYITIITTAALVSSVLWYLSDTLFTLLYYDYPISAIYQITFNSFAKRVIGIFILLAFWCASYFIINLFYRWKLEREDKERALYNALKAKMEVLKNQINPHFLFNSLNSISAMVDENPSRAQLIIDELASFLRYTLTYKESSRIELKKEIAFIKNYIYIQTIRFEEKLEFYINIDPRTESLMVPPAILYPIVENAVKHGMETSELPLKIYITSFYDKERITLSVKNTGRWVDYSSEKSSGTNTGLMNVKERLYCEYNDRCLFEVTSSDEFVEVNLIFLKNL